MGGRAPIDSEPAIAPTAAAGKKTRSREAAKEPQPMERKCSNASTPARARVTMQAFVQPQKTCQASIQISIRYFAGLHYHASDHASKLQNQVSTRVGLDQGSSDFWIVSLPYVYNENQLTQTAIEKINSRETATAQSANPDVLRPVSCFWRLAAGDCR